MRLKSTNTLKIILNPGAGNARLLFKEEISDYLQEKELPHEWVTLTDLKTLASKTRTHHNVLIIGGDGTLHATLNAIGYGNLHKFSFGILPAGTGNDFARSLEIPMNIREALDTVTEGHVGNVDLGVLNHRLCFTCAMSLGFGPTVTRNAKRALRKLFGRLALYLGALSYLFTTKSNYKLKMRINQEEEERTVYTPHLVIGNARTHGGGFVISPSADLQNTLLDLYYVKPISFWDIPRLFYKTFKRTDHTRFEEVTYQQIREMQMVLDQPMDVDVDGDLYRFYRRINVKVAPGKLQVFMPESMASKNKLVEDSPWDGVGRNSRAG
jgi:YegS/Rv2252/BmrU family lipid kinase